MRNMIREVNLAPKVTITVNTDSVVGKSMATRYGASRRTRHIELRYFYMQSLVASGLLRINKTSGSENVAYLGTKYLDRVTLSRLRELAGVRPGVQNYDLVQLVVDGQLFTTTQKSPPRPLLRPPTSSEFRQELPQYPLPSQHLARCHHISLLPEPLRYQELELGSTTRAPTTGYSSMGNYSTAASRPPRLLPQEGEDGCK